MMKERDEELVLFVEMQRREKENERNNFLLLPNCTNDVASYFELSRDISSVVSSENDMSDYDWLLTPPRTPLFPALEKEPQISAKGETEISKRRTTALKPREINIITSPASRRTIVSKTHKVMPNLDSSTNGNANRKPSSPSPSRSSTLSSRTKSSGPTLTSAKPIRSSTPIRSSSASKIHPAHTKNPAKSQCSLADAPPKLKVSLPARTVSASRCSRLSSLEAKDNSSSSGRPKRPILRSRSCSINNGENDSPGMIGTKMEKIVNMRKLAPPKLNNAGHHSAVHNSFGKSDSSGFGRSLSKKSLDMAMRHMDMRRSIQDSLKPRV